MRAWFSRPLVAFFSVLAALAALTVALSYLQVPLSWARAATILITVIFIAGPILGLFRAGAHPWTPKFAALFLVAGLAVQFGLSAVVSQLGGRGLAAIVLHAISQQGLPMWTVGLGALLATLLKDRNLLLPVSLFLALFDVFLVLTPSGITRTIMKVAPKLLPSVAHQVPSVQTQAPTGTPVAPFAFVGPADFLFLGLFFVAIFRFGLRARATFLWLLVALAAYLLLAMFVGPVPLLVPIGLTVLIVNLPEFKMTKEEWVSTAVVAALGIGLIAWSATRPRAVEPAPQAVPSPSASGSALAGSASTPAPASPSPGPSASLRAPAGTPNPR